MYMFAGLILLGALSLSLAFFWQKKITSTSAFVDGLKLELGEPDISGKKQYTSCKSHRWVMKNVVIGDYSKAGEGFRNFMMNRTLIGTLILSIFLGIIPVILVYFLFQSFNLIGMSLVLIFIAVYVSLGPGNVEVSNRLVNFLIEDDESDYSVGDIAYASISQKSMESWRLKLVLIGVGSVVLAPWGEQFPVALIWVFTQFIGWAYLNIFVPLSPISMPLALLLYFGATPALFTIIFLSLRIVNRKFRTDDTGGLTILDDGGRQT